MNLASDPLVAPKLPSLWRNREYMVLWGGQAISSLGGNISLIAFPLIVLALTNSPAQAGFVSALRTLTYVLFMLPAGALVDRWDRKKVMIVCDTCRALCLGSIPIAASLGHLTVIQLYITSLIEGTFFVFFNLAETACVPCVVSQEQIPFAMAQNQATLSATELVGPMLGGAIYVLSHVLPFLADAISYVCSVGSLFLIKTPFQRKRVSMAQKLYIEIFEGFRWMWNEPLIRSLAWLTGGNYFALAGMTLIVIVQAQQQHASSFLIGLIFSIGGIGSIVGASLSSVIQQRFSIGTIILSIFWLMTLAWPFYAIAPSPLILGIVTASILLLIPIYNVTVVSYRLRVTPDELQGRVNSAARLIANGFTPLGLACAGWLLQWVGVIPTIIVFAICLGVLALVATLNAHIRHTIHNISHYDR